MELVKKVDKAMYAKFGCVVRQEKSYFHSFYVTEGIQENYQFPEIECYIKVPINTMREIVKRIILLLRNDAQIKTDWLYEGIIAKYEVEFKKIKDSEHLRIILPDVNGFYPNDPLCDKDFKIQYHNVIRH